MSVSEDIIKEIKDKNLEPTPKWHFRLRNFAIWAALAIAVILASLSFSVFVFLMFDVNWRIYPRLERGIFRHILMSFPYLWIVAMLLLLIAGIYDFKYTKKGYGYTWKKIAGVILVFVFFFGFVLFVFGMGLRINRMAKKIPPYQRMMRGREEVWSHPEKGLFAGEIVEIIDGHKLFMMMGVDKNKWNVNGENAAVPNFDFFGVGKKIKLIGEKKDNFNFNAQEIRPWEFNPRMFYGRREIKNIPPRNIK